MSFVLKSPAFAAGGEIPQANAQEGSNSSPALAWEGLPPGTQSLVLLVEDHDAPVGTVTHWVVFDIPADSTGLMPGLEEGTVRQALNDMGHARYDGPKPPKGHGPHRYHFRLAALDTSSLGLDDKPEANDVKKKARSHMLAETELVGLFETR
jgi:Raf kinase inhibitor-like YbhB/YbcL family protein